MTKSLVTLSSPPGVPPPSGRLSIYRNRTADAENARVGMKVLLAKHEATAAPRSSQIRFFPCVVARWRPAFTRSTIMARSNSANTLNDVSVL